MKRQEGKEKEVREELARVRDRAQREERKNEEMAERYEREIEGVGRRGEEQRAREREEVSEEV